MLFCGALLVSSSLPTLEFDMKFNEINVVCNTLLVSGSLPRLEFDVKSNKIDVCFRYFIGF